MDPTETFLEGPRTECEVVAETEGVAKRFGRQLVLRDVSIQARRRETIVIMGPSGCGKSTLLRCLIGAYRPDAGTVRLFGQTINDLPEEELNRLRQRFGIVFQGGALYQSMTVGENVALTLREHTRLAPNIIEIMVKMKLELVGLRDFEDLMPAALSGGMAKRVSIARAIALDPELLFYDEPTTGLDPITRSVIHTLINDLKRALNVASVVVTHDMDTAEAVGDVLVMLHEGRIIQRGTPEEFRASTDPLVRQFVHGLPDGPIPLRRSRTDYLQDLIG
jgi:phospholipid/cholesterol/gamma-HCH transport system ATP-binding protein